MGATLANIAGIVVILSAALALSTARRQIRLRVVASAFALQALLAFMLLRASAGVRLVQGMAAAVSALLACADKGVAFLFGPAERNPLVGSFALGALPVIVFFASLIAVFYHLGIMQRLIAWVGGAIGRLTGISDVEALSAAANIFVGQSESPLVVRPYIADMPPSRLFTLMTVGMAGVAGTILAAYAGLLGKSYLPFLLAASFMSAPGGILMAKLIMPDDPTDQAGKARAPQLNQGGSASEQAHSSVSPDGSERSSSLIEAAAQGAQTGARLALAVGAMVLAFVALLTLVDRCIGWIGGLWGYPELSFHGILGGLFSPVMFLLGIPWKEAAIAGSLFGTKLAMNEFVAFIDLTALPLDSLSAHSRAVTIFALCGFANFTSIAIQMAVIGGLAPNQRQVIARLGLRALAAASLANLMSAALAGIVLPA